MTETKTDLLDHIIAAGNKPPLREPYGQYRRGENIIRCVDGFQMSVIAGVGCYCTPRPDWPFEGGTSEDYPGPYTEVEVGFPSERPEPWEAWSVRAESEDDPMGTVYSYVPIEMVRALVVAHGGEA